ncbi:hypothetical protein ACO0RG_002191 [Hanseniaspora osmophila]
MKIDNVRDSFLSDYEVYKFFNEAQQSNSKRKNAKNNGNNPAQFNQISKDTLEYLKTNKNASTSEENDEENSDLLENGSLNKMCSFNDDLFKAKLMKLNQYQLFKFEKLQLLNALPTNLVHMFSIVEECDNRFSETEINEILEILNE